MLAVLQAAPQDISAVEPDTDSVRALCDACGIALSADYADALADRWVEAVVLTPHALHTAQIAAAVGAADPDDADKGRRRRPWSEPPDQGQPQP